MGAQEDVEFGEKGRIDLHLQIVDTHLWLIGSLGYATCTIIKIVREAIINPFLEKQLNKQEKREYLKPDGVSQGGRG